MTTARRRGLVAALVLGVGVIAAPAIFSMFERAPLGKDMIDEFRPYMTDEKLASFDGYLDSIDATVTETSAELAPGDIPPTVVVLQDEWPAIDDEMSTMLAVMDANVGNYAAVDALPPFSLFPWFFVVPGILVAGFALWALRSGARAPMVAVVVLGVGLILAPVAFQMFTRAPKGGDMLTELGPYMTTEQVGRMQSYFVTFGAAEGALRLRVLPETETALPATADFVSQWPTIGNEMAPMVGVMADNLDNFAAVDALPPFPLFPWFFVAPGVLIAACGVAALRTGPEEETS